MSESVMNPGVLNRADFNNPGLVNILNGLNNDDDSDSDFNFLGESPYYDDESLYRNLLYDKDRFTILTTNIECLNAKHDELILLLDNYKSSGIFIDILCIQETW